MRPGASASYAGLELVNKKTRDIASVRDICFNNGLVMRAIRDMVVSPPLTMTHEQIDELIELVFNCLDLTSRKHPVLPDIRN